MRAGQEIMITHSSSSSDSDPDYVAPRSSRQRYGCSSNNLQSVRRLTRRTMTRCTQALTHFEIEVERSLSSQRTRNQGTIPGKCTRERANVRQTRKKSPMRKNGKWTILSWLINWGTLEVDTEVQYRDEETRLDGKVSRGGILCSCCNDTITVKEFELHAGSSRCESYKNTYTTTGKSLLQCQEETWAKQDIPACSVFQAVDTQKDDVRKNDDICNICGGEGQLTSCDCCPLTYHEDCVGIKTLPEVGFDCTICGMVGGDQAPSFQCFQCEELYHWHCVGRAAVAADGDPSRCTYFCGESCKEVNLELQKLLGIPQNIGNGLSCTLSQHMDQEQVSSHGLPWAVRMECNAKVSLAYAVFEESFKPILANRTGLDRIPTIGFNSGSNLSRLDCHGFYTLTLEKKDDVLAAASIRVHGTKLAEMPFIGTREKYRCEGMCRQLLDTIASVLFSLNVEKLVLPSTPEHVDYWTTHFGFKQISEIERRETMSMNLMMFRDAVLLQKSLLLDDGSIEGQNEAGEALNVNDGLAGENQPSEPLPFDLNIQPPEEEVIMNNVHNNDVQDDGEEKPSLGIFLTLKPDGSLQLTNLFIDGPATLKTINLSR